MIEPTNTCSRCGQQYKIAHMCPIKEAPAREPSIAIDQADLENAKRLLLNFAESVMQLEEFKARGASASETLKRAALEIACDPKQKDKVRNFAKMAGLGMMVRPK